MIGRLKPLMREVNGEWIISFTTRFDPRELYERLKDSEVSLELKKYSAKRSLDANAFAWVLIDQIAEVTGISKTEVYREAIRDIGGVSQVVCTQTENADQIARWWQSKGLGWQAVKFDSKLEDCTNMILYCGSSEYNTVQMSRLIDNLIQEAETQGIPTMPDRDVERLKNKWAKKKKEDNTDGNDDGGGGNQPGESG